MKTAKKIVSTLLLAIVVSALLPAVASACPMCKAAAEQDENQPKAYMYSILFMLSMPAVIFGSFGYGIYRMNQRENDFSSLDEELHALHNNARDVAD